MGVGHILCSRICFCTKDEYEKPAAAEEDVCKARYDALMESRQGWQLWRLSECRTLREELGEEGQFDCP